MTLRDYLRILRERWTIVASTIVLVTIATLLFSFRQTPIYSAAARLVLQPVAPGSDSASVIRERTLQLVGGIATEAEILRSEKVAQRVADRLGLKIPADKLIEAIQVLSTGYSAVLNVTASSPDRLLAKKLADAFAEEYIAYARQRAVDEADAGAREMAEKIKVEQDRFDRVESQIRSAPKGGTEEVMLQIERTRIISNLGRYQSKYDAFVDTSDIDRGAGDIIQYASVPGRASSPNHVRNGILCLFVSIPLAIGLTLLRDSLSDAIKTKEEAERITGAATLALIPYDSDWRDPDDPYLASVEDPSSAFAEAYRTLRVNLEFSGLGDPVRYVLVTSPGRSEGKTVTAANLGVAFAEAGRRTVLVSTDLRRPRLHEFLDAEREPGLSDALRGDAPEGTWLTGLGPNLWFVPSGSENGLPDVRLDRGDLDSMFGRLGGGSARASGARRGRAGVRTPRAGAKTTDIVVLDAPPVLRAAEAASLATAVDGVVLVIFAGITRRTAAARAAEQIRKVGGKVLGLTLVGVREEDGYGHNDLRGDFVNRAWDRVVDALRR